MIFVTGDTHKTDLESIQNFCNNHKDLTKDDFIIIAGDFGAVWSKDTLEKDLKPFTLLPVTILFVDGNHENFTLLNTYQVEIWNGGKVHRIKENIIHLMRGQVFTLDNKTIFTFGGATSLDRDHRVEGESWWKEELPTYEELDEGIENLKKHNYIVDYVITHSCTERALMYPILKSCWSYDPNCFEVSILSTIESYIKFKCWYFGHFHIDAKLGNKYRVLLHDIVKLE